MKTPREPRAVIFLRCPPALREQIEVAAEENLRTVTAEANFRLLRSFETNQQSHTAAYGDGQS